MEYTQRDDIDDLIDAYFQGKLQLFESKSDSEKLQLGIIRAVQQGYVSPICLKGIRKAVSVISGEVLLDFCGADLTKLCHAVDTSDLSLLRGLPVVLHINEDNKVQFMGFFDYT